jgi:hypothetical protein
MNGQPTMHPTPARICAENAARNTQIGVRALDKEDDIIVIEGGREGLAFLDKLLLAQAASKDRGFQLGPRRAGKALFTAESTKGPYIHRLDKV